MDFKTKPTTDFDPIERLDEAQAAARPRPCRREGIRYHDRLYYVKNRPATSDALYDALFVGSRTSTKSCKTVDRSRAADGAVLRSMLLLSQ